MSQLRTPANAPAPAAPTSTVDRLRARMVEEAATIPELEEINHIVMSPMKVRVGELREACEANPEHAHTAKFLYGIRELPDNATVVIEKVDLQAMLDDLDVQTQETIEVVNTRGGPLRLHSIRKVAVAKGEKRVRSTETGSPVASNVPDVPLTPEERKRLNDLPMDQLAEESEEIARRRKEQMKAGKSGQPSPLPEGAQGVPLRTSSPNPATPNTAGKDFSVPGESRP